VSFGRVGRYELIAQLATGGMGEVFLARTRGLAGFEKLVVIKRALPSLVKSDRHHLLFAEARLAATLSHANIVQVHDVGREDDAPGAVFLAMEFLHGQDVRAILRREPRLPLAQALAIAQSICAGLHYAHEKRDSDGQPLGIVHRDVSPSNVFVTYDGAVKLIDFGIAKATTLPSETQQGTVKGKPGYMSPEQCRGEPLDRRSDLFCVGILLYEMTTGRSPFTADTEYLTYQHIIESTPPTPSSLVPDYPPTLESLVLEILHKHRRERPATALAIQERLAAIARELELDTSALALERYLAALFSDELASWHAARDAGTSLEDHVIRRTTIERAASPSRSPDPVAVHPGRRTVIRIAGISALALAAAVTVFVATREPAGQATVPPAPDTGQTGQAGPARVPDTGQTGQASVPDTGHLAPTRPSVSSHTGPTGPTGQARVPDTGQTGPTGHAGQARVPDTRPTGHAKQVTTKAAPGPGSSTNPEPSAGSGSAGSAQQPVLGPDDLL
jgi:eukaryotic-like serine/threonine-protein kinase